MTTLFAALNILKLHPHTAANTLKFLKQMMSPPDFQ
jgi:hypothetical protein